MQIIRAVALFGVLAAACRAANTPIVDTILRADGTPANCRYDIKLQDVSIAGQTIVISHITYDVIDGAMGQAPAAPLALVPNDLATPANTLYKVSKACSDGSGNSEYWFVTSSITPLTIQDIRSDLKPSAELLLLASQISPGVATFGMSIFYDGVTVRWGFPPTDSTLFTAPGVNGNPLINTGGIIAPGTGVTIDPASGKITTTGGMELCVGCTEPRTINAIFDSTGTFQNLVAPLNFLNGGGGQLVWGDCGGAVICHMRTDVDTVGGNLSGLAIAPVVEKVQSLPVANIGPSDRQGWRWSNTNGRMEPGIFARDLSGSCSGLAAPSAIIGLFGLGQISTLTCTSNVTSVGRPVSSAGYIKNLIIESTAPGANPSSGLAVVYVNATATTITCTIGTSTFCLDQTHQWPVATADVISVPITTQAGETLANLRVTIEKY